MTVAAREKRRPYWVVTGDLAAAASPAAIDARDLPSAWRRAERDAGESSFALYGPDRTLLRVGLPPPPPFARIDSASAIALTPDGERLYVARGNVVRMYDAASGETIWSRTIGDSVIDAFVLPQRANYMVALTRAGDVFVLERDRGEAIVHVHDENARAVALSPDDRLLAIAGLTVEVWSLPEAVRVATLDLDVATAVQAARAMDDALDDDDEPGREGIFAIGFSGDGLHLVGARTRQGGELVSWSLRSGERVASIAGMAVQRVVPSRHGAHAFVRIHDEAGVVREFEVPSMRLDRSVTTSADALWDLRVSPDERFLLAHDDETGLYVIERATAAPHAWLDEYEACAYVVKASRVGERARKRREAMAHEDTHVVALPRWGRNDPGAPMSADGRRYAALRRHQDARMVAVFDLTRCTPYAALAHSAPCTSVWLDGQGRRVATRDAEGRVFVWSLPEAPSALA